MNDVNSTLPVPTDTDVKSTTAVVIGTVEERLLTLDEIFSADDLKVITVEIPEWPKKNGQTGVIRLKTMTADEAIAFTKKAREDKEAAMILLVQRCAVLNDNATKMFKEEQIVMLRKKSIKVFNRLQNAALELNGFTEEKAKEVGKD